MAKTYWSQPEPGGHGELVGNRLVVVEDNPDTQRLAELLLTRMGATVAVCPDGLVAIDCVMETLRTTAIDAIFMDMNLPFISGYETTRRLRKAGVDCKIIALTAENDELTPTRCLAAGCVAYLAKPIRTEDVLRVLKE